MKHFFFLSRDPRFSALEKQLLFHKHSVSYTLPPSFPEHSVLFFPFSAKEGEILSCLEKIPVPVTVVVGKKGEALRLLCKKKGHRLLPILENEGYVQQNAVATAEGFLSECIAKTDVTLADLTVLVIGYGNCGKAIAKLLFLCGSEVYIQSRQGSMNKAEEDGFSLFPNFSSRLSMFDCIVNTVPDAIFPPDFFSLCRDGSLFFQIASGLSGLTSETAKENGVLFFPLPALPARFSPVTEGDNLFAALDPILRLSTPPERE